MWDVVVRGAELEDEWGYPYVIVDHGEETPLGHPLLAVQELFVPIHVSHHQDGSVVISVESELRATGSLKLDGPQHFRPILLIERVFCINDEEALVFLLGVLLPKEAHCMYASIDPCLHPSTQLICPACLIFFLYCHLQQTLLHQPLASFSHPHGLQSRILIDYDQMDRHERVISVPWRPLIHHPLVKLSNNLP